MNSEKVIGIPKLSGQSKLICGECMKGKQKKSSHKKVKEIRTTKLLDFLHMDIMGHLCTKCRGVKRYVLVVVDDFSRYSFVSFLKEKLETREHLKSLFTRIQGVIRGNSLTMWTLTSFVSQKELNPPGLLNIMEWLNEKIKCYKKWLEWWFIVPLCNFGLKL